MDGEEVELVATSLGDRVPELPTGDADHRIALREVLGALRTAGDEREFTQTVATFARADAEFAAQLARTLIEAAPGYTEQLLKATPREAACTAEYPLFREGKYKGPVDLLFHDDQWALLVEHKLYSDYDPTQLQRYMEGGSALGRSRWGLMAVTREEPDHRLEPAPGTPHWLGSARWAALVDRLRQIGPEDPHLATLWQTFLDVETDNGDFGVINLDPEAVHGWAAWKKGRSQLATLLRDLVHPTRACLTERVPADRACDQLLHSRTEGLWLLENSIHARFSVPAGGRERLRVQFLSADNELYFTVEARHEDFHGMASQDRDAYRERARELRDREFKLDERHLVYVAHVHNACRWLRDDGQESARILRDLIEQDVEALVSAGLLGRRFDLPVA